jgi:hypothetical protein
MALGREQEEVVKVSWRRPVRGGAFDRLGREPPLSGSGDVKRCGTLTSLHCVRLPLLKAGVAERSGATEGLSSGSRLDADRGQCVASIRTDSSGPRYLSVVLSTAAPSSAALSTTAPAGSATTPI